jgi:thiamine transporter ThiT
MNWGYAVIVIFTGFILGKIHWSIAVATGIGLVIYPLVMNADITMRDAIGGGILCAAAGGLSWHLKDD